MRKYWINARWYSKACDQVSLPLNCHDLIGKVVCNPITELCAKGKCENCPEIDLEPLADCDSITYYRWWQGEKYYEKELIGKGGIVIVAEMKDNIKDIKMHYYHKRTQNNEFITKEHKIMNTRNKLKSKMGKP